MDEIKAPQWDGVLMTVFEFLLYADADRETLSHYKRGSETMPFSISDILNIHESYKYLLQENKDFFEESIYIIAANRFCSLTESNKSSIYAHNAPFVDIRHDVFWVYVTMFFIFFRYHVSRTGKSIPDDGEIWERSTEILSFFECSKVGNEWIQDVYELSDEEIIHIEFYLSGFEDGEIPTC